MGIEYSAAIIVGLPKDDLFEHESYEDFQNGDLDQAPPFYDGGEAAIMGIIVEQSGDYSAMELNGSLDAKISAAEDSFKEKTGMTPKVYLTPVGY